MAATHPALVLRQDRIEYGGGILGHRLGRNAEDALDGVRAVGHAIRSVGLAQEGVDHARHLRRQILQQLVAFAEQFFRLQAFADVVVDGHQPRAAAGCVFQDRDRALHRDLPAVAEMVDDLSRPGSFAVQFFDDLFPALKAVFRLEHGMEILADGLFCFPAVDPFGRLVPGLDIVVVVGGDDGVRYVLQQAGLVLDLLLGLLAFADVR